MTGDAERTGRASNYILGLMSEAERQRAERDLELDPSFRDAVMQLAEQMDLFDRQGETNSQEQWQAVASRLAELPQMRRSLGQGVSAVAPSSAMKPSGMALNTLPNRRALVTAIGLVVAFALGYLAAKLQV